LVSNPVRGKRRREGLIPAALGGTAEQLKSIGPSIADALKTPYEYLFTGQGFPEATSKRGGANPREMLGKLPSEEPPKRGGLGDVFFSSPWPEAQPMPGYTPGAPPDFSDAKTALGAAPTEPEPIKKGEKLIRMLGAMSAGALRGSRGRGEAGQVLAGAGAGMGSVIGQMQREEESRQQAYKTRYERHKQNLARIETMAATAKSTALRQDANMQYQVERDRWKAERQEEMRKAPRVTVDAKGMAKVERVIDGEYQVYLIDTQMELKQALLMATAQAKDKTFFMGKPVDSSSLTPLNRQLADESMDYMMSGRYLQGDFRDMLDAVMQEYFNYTSVKEVNEQWASGAMDTEEFIARLQAPIMMTMGRMGEMRLKQQLELQQGRGGGPNPSPNPIMPTGRGM